VSAPDSNQRTNSNTMSLSRNRDLPVSFTLPVPSSAQARNSGTCCIVLFLTGTPTPSVQMIFIDPVHRHPYLFFETITYSKRQMSYVLGLRSREFFRTTCVSMNYNEIRTLLGHHIRGRIHQVQDVGEHV
jgi:hypothetical protein